MNRETNITKDMSVGTRVETRADSELDLFLLEAAWPSSCGFLSAPAHFRQTMECTHSREEVDERHGGQLGALLGRAAVGGRGW